MNNDLKRYLDTFDTKFFCKIIGHQLDDFVLNQLLLNETELRPVISLVQKYQFKMYEYLACFLDQSYLQLLFLYEITLIGD